MHAWIMLGLAGLFEVAWAIGLKYADGFTRPLASALTIAAMIASMYLLALAARTLPIGTAYAVWTGIGAVGAALLGMMLFGESANPVRLGCIALIVAGIAGLKFSTPG
jgi:quaternary ammonium compound-resistance protein SugE